MRTVGCKWMGAFTAVVIGMASIGAADAALIPHVYFDCVVAVGYKQLVAQTTPSGQVTVVRSAFVPVGSGFLYGDFIRKVDDQNNSYDLYVVTNSHVIDTIARLEREQADQITKTFRLPVQQQPTVFLRFNLKGQKPARDDLELAINGAANGQPSVWLRHNGADLAIAFVPMDTAVWNDLEAAVFRSNIDILDRAAAKEAGVTEGDGVFALGFPMGLVGGARNYVIARQGTIARIRDCLDGLTNEWLADLFVFPGNSGGPVITKVEMVGITGTKIIHEARLIGIVREYIPYRDVAVSRQTGNDRIVFEENSGLAGIIPVDYLQELVTKYRPRVRREHDLLPN